jgi:predicted nuclease of predicted toxin-antitoxin system
MKFIVDAQLPYRLKDWLTEKGFDTIHTRDLPEQNETEDLNIADIAQNESRTVISKDSDFLKLRILQDKPEKLLMITTGNIVNKDLLSLFEQNFETVEKLFVSFDVVEMNNSFVIGHDFNQSSP